ncbi:toast rack family protein [Clostridium sp. JNZ J1-5]
MSLKKGIVSVLLTLGLLGVTGCAITINGPVSTKDKKITVDKKVIELEGVKKANIKLSMGVGDLIIDKNTDKLMEGEFSYRDPEWKPEVDYKVNGNEGELKINQPHTQDVNVKMGKNDYKWNLMINKHIPMNMDVELGVGKGDINLKEVNIKNLNIKTGVGDIVIDLTGDYKEDVNLTIEGGVGNTIVYLPKNIGVKVKAERGIGAIKTNELKKEDDFYVNDSYKKTKNNINVDIETGVGRIEFKLK